MIKARLFTPGPTDVPPEVLIEMAKPMFHHRTPQFQAMFAEVNLRPSSVSLQMLMVRRMNGVARRSNSDRFNS